MTPTVAKRNHHQDWMPSIFNDFLGHEWLESFANRVNSLPAMNIAETENEYRIELAVPGLEKGDFLAMVIAAFITFLPVLLITMVAVYGLIWVLLLR